MGSAGSRESLITTVALSAYVVLGLLGTVALLIGTAIALLAVRRAPDGFEDREGYHSGPTTEVGPAGAVMPAEDKLA